MKIKVMFSNVSLVSTTQNFAEICSLWQIVTRQRDSFGHILHPS